MRDVQNRGWVRPLVDLVLLVVLLEAGFLLNPQSRPELAMLGAAAVVQLFVSPRSGRSLIRALASAAVIFLLYAFIWRRPNDARPLVPWLVVPAWPLVTGRLPTPAAIWHRV